MEYAAYLRLIIAIIGQAIEDVRKPVVWDSDPIYRPGLRRRLQEEAKEWLLDSSLIDLTCQTWSLERSELIERISKCQYPHQRKFR